MQGTEDTHLENWLFLVVQYRRLVIELKSLCNDVRKNLETLDISLPCTDTVVRAEAIHVPEEYPDWPNHSNWIPYPVYENDIDKLAGIGEGVNGGYQENRKCGSKKRKSLDTRTGWNKFSADFASFLELLVELEASLSSPEINENLSSMALDLNFFKSLYTALAETTVLLPNLTSVSKSLDSSPAQLRPFIRGIFEQSWKMFDEHAIAALQLISTTLWIELFKVRKAKKDTHLQRALGIPSKSTRARSLEGIKPWLSDLGGVSQARSVRSGDYSVREDRSIARSDNRSNWGRTVSSLRHKSESERGSVRSGDYSVREDRSIARSDNRSNWGRTVSSLYSESESGYEPTAMSALVVNYIREDDLIEPKRGHCRDCYAITVFC